MVRFHSIVAALAGLVLVVAGCGKSGDPAPVAPSPFGSLEVVVNSESVGRTGVGVTVLSSGFSQELTTDSTGTAHTGGIPVGMATVTLHGFPDGYAVSPADVNPKQVNIQSELLSHLTFTLHFDQLHDVPINDSPQATMERFRQAYQRQAVEAYAELFTEDFRFLFSSATDPSLVAQYGPNWGRDDEAQSADHLFGGFTSSATGQFMPGATNINMALNSVQYFADPAHTDSTGYYQFVPVSRVVIVIEVPGDAGGPQIYNIDAPQEFHLVRGDAAHLGSSQSATPDRWYIRSWDDMSAPVSGFKARRVGLSPEASTATTWGHLKAVYR
jgi:hypothetical protein